MQPFYCSSMIPRRIAKGKEDPERLSEKFGIASIPRPTGKVLWIHAASMGESLSVIPLVQEIKTHYPHWHILMTSGTVTSARIIEKRLGHGVLHQYMPLDFQKFVKRFMNFWTPDLVFWVESELWPHALLEIKRRGIPAVSINTRISPRSLKRWGYFPKTFDSMLSTFSMILPQTQNLQESLKSLGFKQSQFIGNMKFASKPDLERHQELLELIKPLIGKRSCFMAASTHPGEEPFINRISLALQKTYPDLLTIIAPRHPDRVGSIIQELGRQDCVTLSALQTGQGIKNFKSIGLLIVDQMGVLNAFYSLKPMVFVGGSLVPHGGQNPIEPSFFGCSVLFGPHMFNFSEVTKGLIDAGGAVEVVGEEVLLSQVDALLSKPKIRHTMEKNAQKYVADHGQIIERAMALLAPYFERKT